MAYLTKTDQDRIDAVVENIKMQTGISSPEDNIVALAKTLGITVFETKFVENDTIDGLLEYPKKTSESPKIFLNKERPATRKKFTLAHEIGHYVLHRNKKTKYRIDPYDYSENDHTTKEETEANYFAASLLVPKEKLKSILALSKGSLEMAASYFGVSKPVIENRIKWLQEN
jgi:Zn-dependent peptidase ImmA (M78 family)